jgi:His-Xaa-Ser system protein HxsD
MKKNIEGFRGTKISEKKSKITIKIAPRIYPLEVIYGAAYSFVDRAYIDIGGNPKRQVLVTLAGKEDLSRKELERLAGEFRNELLNYALRRAISQNNKELREYIVSRALFSSVVPAEEEFGLVKKKIQEAEKKDRAKKIKKGDFIDDPFGIAVPWEEKYGKN